MSVLKDGAPDLLEYLPGYRRIGPPHNISAIIRRLEERVAELSKPAPEARLIDAHGYDLLLQARGELSMVMSTTKAAKELPLTGPAIERLIPKIDAYLGREPQKGDG